MEAIDETFMECPWYGSRKMVRHLRRNGRDIGRRRARRLMAKMGLTPIYQRPRTSDPHPQHRIYPYLLRKLAIDRPDVRSSSQENPTHSGHHDHHRHPAKSASGMSGWTAGYALRRSRHTGFSS